METDKNQNIINTGERYKVWFFAGAETRDEKFNIFTGSYIRLMKKILDNDFEFIKGIYYATSMANIIWALNHAQRPISGHANHKITTAAFNQIIEAGLSPDTQLIITSSSSGSIVAAQTACYLAEKNRNNVYFRKPFHLVLGASMISTGSDLYKQLLRYQKEGTIGTILHDEVQDEGDNSAGVGGLSIPEAYKNVCGLIFPFLSRKYHGPSFLNSNPETGHLHRRRSKTVRKALDYINIILIQHRLAGDHYMEVAKSVMADEIIHA
jgi:hypothetical protein